MAYTHDACVLICALCVHLPRLCLVEVILVGTRLVMMSLRPVLRYCHISSTGDSAVNMSRIGDDSLVAAAVISPMFALDQRRIFLPYWFNAGDTCCSIKECRVVAHTSYILNSIYHGWSIREGEVDTVFLMSIYMDEKSSLMGLGYRALWGGGCLVESAKQSTSGKLKWPQTQKVALG